MIELDTLYLLQNLPPELMALQLAHDTAIKSNVSLKKEKENLKMFLWMFAGSVIVIGIFYYHKTKQDDERRKND